MNVRKDMKDIKNKFKNLQAFSFTTEAGELMVCFDGFEEEDDIKEFADFLFNKLKMNHSNMNGKNFRIH